MNRAVATLCLCSIGLAACWRADADDAAAGSETMAGSDTSSTRESGTSLGDGDGDGDPNVCPNNDNWEPNELPEAPVAVPWDVSTLDDARVHIAPFLCAGEDDWFLFNVNELEFDYYALHLDGIVMGSSWCGASCGDPFLPAAPEHGLGIEVFDAETMMLLNSDIGTAGRVDLGGWGDAYARDLLVHLYGPTPAATYGYELYVEIRGYDGEDECEC